MRHYMFSVLSILGLSVIFFGTMSAAPALADKLVMFDSKHCPTCIKFKREMAGKYWKSDLGKQLPLSIVNSNSNRAMARYEGQVDPISFTPTFVLISDGEEVARFIGYNGRKHFLSEVKRVRQYWNK